MSMKKLFKATTIILSAVLFSILLSSCGAEKQTIYSTLKEAGEIEKFNYTITGDIVATNPDEEPHEINSKIEISGIYEDEKHMTMAISMQMPETTDMVKFTDMYIVEDSAYVNVRSLFNAMDTLNKKEGFSFSDSLTFEGDYIQIPLEEIKTEEETEIVYDEKEIEVAKDIANTFIDFVETAVKDIEPALVSQEGNKHIFSVSDKNIAQLINNLGTVLDENIDKTIDDFIKKYEEKGTEYEEIVSKIKQFKEQELSKAKEAFAEMKEFQYTEEMTFEAKASVELNGKEGERDFTTGLSFQAQEGNIHANMNLNCNIKELDTENAISAPDSIISEEEMAKIQQQLSQLMMGELNPTPYNETHMLEL